MKKGFAIRKRYDKIEIETPKEGWANP